MTAEASRPPEDTGILWPALGVARFTLSHRTVQNHVQNTLRKLQLHDRVELVRYAIEQGLDDDGPGQW